ncbi:MAG TPA: molybdopterin-dependent oxidoreductase, partial [Bacteroidales bacterium]|nr:molybdopterin-dependent oxidoreductase [Bacteroidales bacterium]
KASENPVVIAGVHTGSAEVMKAAANVARALSLSGKQAGLCLVLPEANSLGLAMIDPKPLEEAIDLVEQAEQVGKTVIILENDLYRRSRKERIDSLMQKSKLVISLDHSYSPTTSKAQVVLPVGSFAESEGTLVNNEGRAQRFYKAIPPGNAPIESWRLLSEYRTLDDIIAAMTAEVPVFEKIKEYLPDADFRIYNEKISRQTKRYSGRTATMANVNVHEQKPPADPDSPLVFSMEGTVEANPSSLVPYYWKPGWNSYQAMNYYLDKPDGSMKGGDPGIRLIEQKPRPEILYFEPQKSEDSLEKDEWLILPVYQIFGSEEMSSMAPAVAERIAEPFVLVNEKDADSIRKAGSDKSSIASTQNYKSKSIGSPDSAESDLLNLTIGNSTIEVRVKIDPAVPSKTMGLSVMLPGMEYLELPAIIKH